MRLNCGGMVGGGACFPEPAKFMRSFVPGSMMFSTLSGIKKLEERNGRRGETTGVFVSASIVVESRLRTPDERCGGSVTVN